MGCRFVLWTRGVGVNGQDHQWENRGQWLSAFSLLACPCLSAEMERVLEVDNVERAGAKLDFIGSGPNTVGNSTVYE